MKILCKDRHYRTFKYIRYNEDFDFFECQHCREIVREDMTGEKLKNHTCKTRIEVSILERLKAVQCIVSLPCDKEAAKCAYDELDSIIDELRKGKK